jgi:sugar/nucleoside kinase (ribokinase family)
VLGESPVGAGDAFAAGFLLALAGGESLAAALRAGCDAVAPRP